MELLGTQDHLDEEHLWGCVREFCKRINLGCEQHHLMAVEHLWTEGTEGQVEPSTHRLLAGDTAAAAAHPCYHELLPRLSAVMTVPVNCQHTYIPSSLRLFSQSSQKGATVLLVLSNITKDQPC